MRPYRKNVGIVVFNRTGQVLVGERLAYPGVFQFPQGGIDPGEDPEVAGRRELYEEIGLRLDAPPVFEVPDWLRYEFPPDIPPPLNRFRGQEQKWYFFFWDGSLETLDLDAHVREFESVRWADFRAIAESIVLFKRPVYLELYRQGAPMIAEYVSRVNF